MTNAHEGTYYFALDIRHRTRGKASACTYGSPGSYYPNYVVLKVPPLSQAAANWLGRKSAGLAEFHVPFLLSYKRTKERTKAFEQAQHIQYTASRRQSHWRLRRSS